MSELNSFADKYLKNADVYLKCQLSGDYKKGNRCMRVLAKMDQQFECDKLLYEQMLDIAIKQDNIMAQIKLYSYGLIRDYNEKQCVTELQKFLVDKHIESVQSMIKLLLDKYVCED